MTENTVYGIEPIEELQVEETDGQEYQEYSTFYGAGNNREQSHA